MSRRDEIDRLIDTDPIALGRRCRAAEAECERLSEAERERDRLRDALIEIDTYLANDPDVWRIVSVCKVGEVLCDVLGAETIGRINASVESLLCPRCLDEAVTNEGEPMTAGTEVIKRYHVVMLHGDGTEHEDRSAGRTGGYYDEETATSVAMGTLCLADAKAVGFRIEPRWSKVHCYESP